MQRRLRITLTVLAATGAVALGAGTAFADDASDSPANLDQAQQTSGVAENLAPNLQAPNTDTPNLDVTRIDAPNTKGLPVDSMLQN